LSISLTFPHLNPFVSIHPCHMPRPSHSFPFYHPNNIWWRVHMYDYFHNTFIVM
jgi:hypothetical protein